MSQEIRTKLSDWWQLISAQETIETFTKFFVLTWKILKDTIILMGFLILFVFVYAGLVWDKGTQLGQTFKQWRAQVDAEPDSQWVAEVGKAAWESTKALAGEALNKAKAQLGMEAVGPSASSAAPASRPQVAAQPQAAAQPLASAQPAPPSQPATPPQAPPVVAASTQEGSDA
jgi:hypothetical protein